MKVGSIDVFSVKDGQFVYTLPAGVPPLGSDAREPHLDYMTADGRYLNDIGGFVVRTKDRLMLIDAGCGPRTENPVLLEPFEGAHDAPPEMVDFFRKRGLDEAQLKTVLDRFKEGVNLRHGTLGASIEALGLRLEDFTDVILTHLHFDHVGWVSDGVAPLFPNATYRCERRDADYFLDPSFDDSLTKILFDGMSTRERMTPVLDRLELWDGDAELAPGVSARFAPGHTPGSSVIVISSDDQRAMILGDVAHCPLELTNPEFSILSDLDADLANRTREAICREVEGEPVLIGAPHFPDLRFGRLLPGQGQRGWTFNVSSGSA